MAPSLPRVPTIRESGEYISISIRTIKQEAYHPLDLVLETSNH